MKELPKPLDKDTGAGGSTCLQGGWANRPVIADETGAPMDRGGEEAVKEMNRQATELLVEQLGRQMKELFSGLAQKQEEDNKRLVGGSGRRTWPSGSK